MKRYRWLLFLSIGFAAASCGSSSEKNEEVVTENSITVSEPVSETRATVKTTPAAEYSEPIKDDLNNWKFAVALYETNRTFHYTVRIQCKEVRVSDSINIPNFGIIPKVAIQKGKTPLSCIIGFLDKKDVFQEYREVSFKDEQLHVKTLHTYSVATYKTKVNKE